MPDTSSQTLAAQGEPRRLPIPESGAVFDLQVPTPSLYVLFLQHQPEEFRFQLTHLGTPIKPLSETHYAHSHSHDSTVTSVGISTDQPLDLKKFDPWISTLLREKGGDLFRSKGILNFKGTDRRFVFQGVHMLIDSKLERPWQPDEKRFSQIIFIGRNLDRAALVAGFQSCIDESLPPIPKDPETSLASATRP